MQAAWGGEGRGAGKEEEPLATPLTAAHAQTAALRGRAGRERAGGASVRDDATTRARRLTGEHGGGCRGAEEGLRRRRAGRARARPAGTLWRAKQDPSPVVPRPAWEGECRGRPGLDRPASGRRALRHFPARPLRAVLCCVLRGAWRGAWKPPGGPGTWFPAAGSRGQRGLESSLLRGACCAALHRSARLVGPGRACPARRLQGAGVGGSRQAPGESASLGCMGGGRDLPPPPETQRSGQGWVSPRVPWIQLEPSPDFIHGVAW